MNLRDGCLALALLVSCCNAFAADIKCDEQDRHVIDAYDPGADTAKRQQAVEWLIAGASLCPTSVYPLGQLYRHGSELPGNLLAKNVQKAQELILASAEDGYLFAYADLAEMALNEKQPREAMKWTQVYLYFLTRHSDRFDRGSGSFDRSGYNAELLARATVAGEAAKPRLSRKLIRADLADYLQSREAAVAAKLLEREEKRMASTSSAASASDKLRIKGGKGACFANPTSLATGYATYLLEVQPSGVVSRVVLENFSPDLRIDEALRRCVEVYQFDAFAGDQPQVIRIPAVYGYRNRSQLKF
ncbi:MAG TPA: hypothetical protein VGQ93_08200 [Lysobacter sp.]|jgi:hypothetical protein|nr:hypothetical protein [Lysobacter sp.]